MLVDRIILRVQPSGLGENAILYVSYQFYSNNYSNRLWTRKILVRQCLFAFSRSGSFQYFYLKQDKT